MRLSANAGLSLVVLAVLAAELFLPAAAPADRPLRSPRLPARAAALRGPGADRPPVRGPAAAARVLRHPRHCAGPDLAAVAARAAGIAVVPRIVGRIARAFLRGLRRV